MRKSIRLPAATYGSGQRRGYLLEEWEIPEDRLADWRELVNIANTQRGYIPAEYLKQARGLIVLDDQADPLAQ